MDTKEAKAKAKKPSAQQKKRTSKKKEAGVLAHARNSMSLMALTPYRFPIDPERLAVNTARISGFAFIFLAMIFTYKFFETVATNHMMSVAQTGSVVSAIIPLQTPPVSFAYTALGAGDGHAITVTVSDAEAVTLYAYDLRTGEYRTLGNAQPVGGNTWHYEWNTSGISSGNYWIKALVTNQYGMYDRSDSQYVVVN